MRSHDKMLSTKLRYKATEHMRKTDLIQHIAEYFIFFLVWFTLKKKQAYPSWIKWCAQLTGWAEWGMTISLY